MSGRRPGGSPPGAGAARTPLALRSPGFRRLYAALVASSTGDWLGFLATTALAAQLVDGVSAQLYATGGVLAFRLLPAVLLGPLAGAFVDRFDRRRTMVVCDVLRCVLFLSIPLVGTLTWLLVASFLVEALSLFWIPAKEASVPNLVPRAHLESANQLSLIATYGTAALAAAVFSVLGLLGGSGLASAPSLALFIDAGTFLFAAVQVSRLDLSSPAAQAHEQGQAPPSLSSSLREGLRFARTSGLVRGLLVGMLGALAAAGTVIAQGRVFAESVLAGGDAAYGLLFGAVFVGIAVGVALGPRLLGDMSRRRAFGPAIVAAGLSLVVLSLVPSLAVAVVAVLLVGAFAGVAYVVGLTLLGGEVADEVRGRTFALVQSLMRIDLLVVLSVVPTLSALVGVRALPLPGGGELVLKGVSVTILVGGLLAVLVGLVSFRQMDDRPGVRLRSDLWALLHRVPRAPTYPGTFLAVEGGEGAGKSTQVTALAEWLRESGREVVVTREPGSTVVGARLRDLLLDPATRLDPRTEALLYAADRAEHVASVIVPALERGAVVLTDRYVDSSLAYQGAGRDLPVAQVAQLSRWATGGVRPDLVLLLDVDPAVGLARARGVGRPDRIEAESLAFHARVRQGFLDLAAAAPERYLVVQADRPAPDVTALVRRRLDGLLPAHRSRPRAGGSRRVSA